MKRLFVVFLSVFLISSQVFCAIAQEEEDIEISEIRVTYTRGEQDPRKIPANVVVIGSDEIEKSGATNVPDLLRKEAGINVRSYYGTTKYSSIDMRGFVRGIETLVMINGVRLNNPDLSSVDWAMIPIESVERIEITKGPGTVLWGDDAVAGVVNIITKKGYDVPIFKLEASYGSYNSSETSASLGYSKDLWTIFLSGGYHYSDGFRRNSNYEGSDISLSLGVDPTESLALTFDMVYSNDEYELPGGIYDDEIAAYGRKYSYWYNDQGHGERFYTTLGVDIDLDEFGRFEVDYSFRKNSSKYENLPATAGGWPLGYNRNKIGEHGIFAKYIWDYDFEKGENRLTLGLDYRVSGFEQNVNNPYSGGTYITDTDIDRDSISCYLYDELTLLDRWVLSLGYRYEDVTNDIDYYEDSWWGGVVTNRDSINYNEQAYTAGITFLYGEANKVYFRFSKGYRMPLIDEFCVYGFLNTDIKPEKVTGYELGVEHVFDVFGMDMTMTVSLYWDEYDDELYYDPASYANLNYKKTVHRGVDVGLNAAPTDWLDVYVNYAYQDAYFDYSPYKGKKLPLVPTNMVTFGFATDYKGFAFNLDCRWIDSRVLENDLSNAHPRLDSYFVVDMRVAYTYKWLEVFCGIDNITDEEYTDYGGWLPNAARGDIFEYPLPGTTYYTGLAIRF